MELGLGGEHGPSVIFEPTGINIAGAFGRIGLYYRGHKDKGVSLLLIRDENGKFRWEVRKGGRREEEVIQFGRETFERMLDRWLEKWAGI